MVSDTQQSLVLEPGRHPRTSLDPFRSMPPPLLQPQHTVAVALRIDVVQEVEDLRALRPAWDALSVHGEAASPFNSWTWVATWWEVFGPGKKLSIFVVRDAGTIIAIAPFYATVFQFGPLRLRLLLPIGFGNDLTERMEMLVAVGRRAEVLTCFGAYLARCRRRLWDVMIWIGVGAEELPSGLRQLVHEDDMRPFEVCSPPTSWDGFVAGLSKSMRDNLKYYPRLLERHSHRVRLCSATTAEDIKPALDESFRLHGMRATAASMASHDDRFERPQHRRFLERLAPALASQGKLRVELLAVDGLNVAAQLLLEDAGVLYTYYSGFDPEWRKYSVAMITVARSIRDAIERDVHKIDFLMGSGGFKRRWGTHTEFQSRLILVSDSILGRVVFLAYKRLQLLIVKRAALQPRGGVGPRLRVLRQVFRVVGRPTIG